MSLCAAQYIISNEHAKPIRHIRVGLRSKPKDSECYVVPFVVQELVFVGAQFSELVQPA